MGFRTDREAAGLTVQQSATSLGVSIQTVYQWERGENYPEGRRLKEIAELYKCTVDELLTGNFEK